MNHQSLFYPTIQKLLDGIEQITGEELGLYDAFVSENGQASLNRVETLIRPLDEEFFLGEITQLRALSISLSHLSDHFHPSIPMDTRRKLLSFVQEYI